MDPTKILVVEDQPSIAEVVTLYLMRAGYVVTAVRDGEAALALLDREKPDLNAGLTPSFLPLILR